MGWFVFGIGIVCWIEFVNRIANNKGKSWVMSDIEMIRVHAFVRGRVQGVSFRYYTLMKANELGVRGWVRNLRDRRVEVVAEGERGILEHFVVFLHEGSPEAQVEDVAVDWSEATGEFTQFQIGYLGRGE